MYKSTKYLVYQNTKAAALMAAVRTRIWESILQGTVATGILYHPDRRLLDFQANLTQ